jgi:hypothetical protein
MRIRMSVMCDAGRIGLPRGQKEMLGRRDRRRVAAVYSTCNPPCSSSSPPSGAIRCTRRTRSCSSEQVAGSSASRRAVASRYALPPFTAVYTGNMDEICRQSSW